MWEVQRLACLSENPFAIAIRRGKITRVFVHVGNGV